MISGLKIGLLDWKKKLERAKPPFVEVYFRVDKANEYVDMFAYLKFHQIKFGLHFWGVLKSGIEPNFLSRHKWIQNQSVMLMQTAIKAGASNNCVYVNVHPGALRERIIDLDKSEFKIANLPETEIETARKNLLENAMRLKKIAEKYGMALIYETLPTNSPIKWLAPRCEENVLAARQCPIEFYEDLAGAGCFIANDFGHTTGSINMEVEKYKNLSREEKRDIVKDYLFDWTKKLAPATKLIHCNLTLPPFDGVDTHSGILAEDFAKGTLPTKNELIELLKIFKNREDVFILNEPEDRHVENYMELCKILAKI